MAVLRAKMTGKSGSAGSLIRRYFMAGIFACLAAASALAQNEDIVVTLLPSYTYTKETKETDVNKKGYLSVAASGASEFQESESWLYFNAGALPNDIKETSFSEVRLQLVPWSGAKAGAGKGMAITVAPREEKAPGNGTEPLSWFPPAVRDRITLVSPFLPTNPKLLELRSDSVSLPLKGLLCAGKPCQEGRRYIGLLLLPQGNASRRVYYGLNTREGPADTQDHPDRLPRLIITYHRERPAISACASEPSALALIQSDGRLADRSSCNFRTTPHTHVHVVHQVAAGTRTKAPVVYGDRLYVVRGTKTNSRLEELSPLGGFIASVPLVGEVPAGSPMVVDRFGRLRIITNKAIFTLDLTKEPAEVDEKAFDFVQLPTAVVPGPDGTLYIVKNSIFALNPEAGKLDASGKVVPQKLWDVAIEDPDSARITLSPDGRFLYALAKFTARKSRFIAINAQTGKDVQLLRGEVNTSGTTVTGVSGMKFDSTAVGQKIPIEAELPSLWCTVQTKSSTSLTCKEDLGRHSGVSWAGGKVNTSGTTVTWVSGMEFDSTEKGQKILIATEVGQEIPIEPELECTVQSKSSTSLTCKETLGTHLGVPWADFPGDLTTFRNPVVARGLGKVDYIYVTGNSGSGATLWGVTNKPVTQHGDFLAQLTAEWEYPLQENSAVGQPILDPSATPQGLAGTKLYFFQGGAGKPKLVVTVEALTGKKVRETSESYLPEAVTEGNPVVDSAGNVILWANGALYGFTEQTANFIAHALVPAMSYTPQLLFGPGGTLYAYGPEPTAETPATVSALIPSFQQSNAGPATIYSPTHLYMTGSAGRQGATKEWMLKARGSVILGENFSVNVGEKLTVCVNDTGKDTVPRECATQK